MHIYEGPEPRSTDDLTILSATYGLTSGYVDVTYHLKRSVRKGRLEITVIPREWNVRDPHPEKKDVLSITYAVKGKIMFARGVEGEKVSIPVAE